MIANDCSVNFTGRCPQIKDAQWVCHCVNSNFPHLSTTRLAPFVEKLEDKFPTAYDKFISANPLVGQVIHATSDEERKVISIFSWMRRLVRTLNIERNDRTFLKDTYSKIIIILGQFNHLKIANCGEDAKLSELIMRLNGHENVHTAGINVGDKHVDHIVCFFNRDGSKFDGTIKNNNTIIIDSWLNEVDFANNMLKRYKNAYKDFMFVPKDGKLSFRDIKSLDLTKEELAQLGSEFPQLLK